MFIKLLVFPVLAMMLCATSALSAGVVFAPEDGGFEVSFPSNYKTNTTYSYENNTCKSVTASLLSTGGGTSYIAESVTCIKWDLSSINKEVALYASRKMAGLSGLSNVSYGYKEVDGIKLAYYAGFKESAGYRTFTVSFYGEKSGMITTVSAPIGTFDSAGATKFVDSVRATVRSAPRTSEFDKFMESQIKETERRARRNP